jgi:DNA-binding NtrC family response regulator
MADTILVVDDEKNIRRTLRMVLEGEGFDVIEAGSAEEAFPMIDEAAPDLVVLDVRLPGMSGVEALEKIRKDKAQSALPIVVISGHASLSEAVQAVQRGANDFLEKPLDRDRMLVSLKNALAMRRLAREVEALKRDAGKRYEMIGDSPAMKRLYGEIEKVAPTRGRVLITGESGTGKELIARAIHKLSPRTGAAFVKVNCAAIPAELIESELFGHERGAFTGAQGRKRGLFEVAHMGTLFLDEIGDMSLAAQAKVLRALQNGEITRVGGDATVAVDVRVIAATNKDLEVAVGKGEFREDLYFRLNVVPIKSPSLRDRLEDVPALARAFLEEFCAENGMRTKPVEAEVMEALVEHHWPGNVRELRNVVERMAILSGDAITLEDLPDFPERALPAEPMTSSDPGVSAAVMTNDDGQPRETLRVFRDRKEREYIKETLDRCDWNISRAATLLGVERTNLHKKMRSLGLKRER